LSQYRPTDQLETLKKISQYFYGIVFSVKKVSYLVLYLKHC